MEDLTFTMPTPEEIVKMNKVRIGVDDGEYTATITGIEEKNDVNGVPYYHVRWDIEGVGHVKDYVAPKNPKAAATANKKLARMASSMLPIPPGASYTIDDFMYKTAIIDVENTESNGRIWPQITNIRKVGSSTPMSSQTREQVLKDFSIASPQPQQEKTSNYHAVVEDEIPF